MRDPIRPVLFLFVACLHHAGAFSTFNFAGKIALNRASKSSAPGPWHVGKSRFGMTRGPVMVFDEVGKLFDKGMDAVFGTKTLERVSEASDDVEEGQPVVVVLDDDFHQVIEVVKSFREVLGCSWKDAFDYTTQIGTKGAAEVFRGTAEECEKIRVVLAEKPHKLDARVGTKGDAQQMGQDKQAAQEQANSERAVLEAVWGTKTFKNGARPRVTVVGGTGRVGAWTIRELFRLAKGDIDFVIAGRNQAAADRLTKQLAGEVFVLGGREWATMSAIKQLGEVTFAEVALDDPARNRPAPHFIHG